MKGNSFNKMLASIFIFLSFPVLVEYCVLTLLVGKIVLNALTTLETNSDSSGLPFSSSAESKASINLKTQSSIDCKSLGDS